jgi:hypothetical protein
VPQSTSVSVDTNNLLIYTKNWPPESQKAFKKSISDHHPFKILFLGSESLGKDPDGWAYLTKQKLAETFGSNNLEIGINEYSQTSQNFVKENKQLEISQSNWDLILFEPFTLNDNGIVKTEDSLKNITTIIEDIKSKSPKTVFILQPPQPLYKATFYPIQVNELKKYAQSHGIVYLDHWTAWPNPSTEEIKNDLTGEHSLPNQNGNRIWSDFVLNYFVSK